MTRHGGQAGIHMTATSPTFGTDNRTLTARIGSCTGTGLTGHVFNLRFRRRLKDLRATPRISMSDSRASE